MRAVLCLMTTALYTIASSLHAKSASCAASEPFVKAIEEALGESFEFCGDDFSDFGRHDADIIYVRTGGTEGIFKSLGLCGSGGQRCFRLLTSGESNSLAASMEILAYLNSLGLHGEILHGSAVYIAGRIRAAADTPAGADDQVKQFISDMPETDLGGVRLGVIGAPSDWLIASGVDYAKAKTRLGVELVDIPMSELLRRLPVDCRKAQPADSHGPSASCDSGGMLHGDAEGNVPAECPPASSAASEPRCRRPVDMRSFEGSAAIYDALHGIVSDFGLGGLTIRCFDLLDSVHNTGCLALARLNAEGIPSSCEGDIPALLSMVYLQKTRGCPGFQCNLSRIDGDELLFAHCTVPLSMVSSYAYATHFESGIGTAIKGEMPSGNVEIFKISPDLEHCVRIPGRLVRNCSEPALCRTQVIVSAPGAPSYLLRSPLANHHIISYVQPSAPRDDRGDVA